MYENKINYLILKKNFRELHFFLDKENYARYIITYFTVILET